MKERSRLPLWISVAAISCIVVGGVIFLFVRTPDSTLPDTPPNSGISSLRTGFISSIQSLGPEDAYAAFKEEYLKKPFGPQHDAAHLFGESLYEARGLSGVRICDADFNFGCFHGFFSKAVRVEGLDVVPALDKECFKSSVGHTLPCQHGLGHGILEFLGTNNLADALNACLLTNRTDPIGGCTSGVFMEYNVPLTDDGEGNFTLSIRALKDENKPYNPCPSVEASFQLSCYHELPQWWQQVLKGDVLRMGVLCEHLEDVENQHACFSGIGNHTAPSTGYDAQKTIEYCNLMPNQEGESLCKRSAAGAFQGNVGDKNGAREVCASIDASLPYQCAP